MPVRSPFLRLDELKRDRDADTYSTMVESARQFGQAPLVLDKIMKENEDRASKKKQQAFTNDLAEAKLTEQGMHNDALESVAKQNADTGGKRVEVQGNAESRRGATAANKEQRSKLKELAKGEFALKNEDGTEKNFDQVLQGVYRNAEAEGVGPEVAASAVKELFDEMGEGKRKTELDNAKLEDQKRRTEAIRARASRVANPAAPKPRLVGEKTLQGIGEKKTMRNKVAKLIGKVDSIASGDAPGLIEDLKEKYGSYAGIQDNQVRMEYLGLFNAILRDRSGMTVTDNELSRLEQEIPSWRAGPDVIIEALDRLRQDLEDEIITTEQVQIEQGGRTLPQRSTFDKPKKQLSPAEIDAAIDAALGG